MKAMGACRVSGIGMLMMSYLGSFRDNICFCSNAGRMIIVIPGRYAFAIISTNITKTTRKIIPVTASNPLPNINPYVPILLPYLSTRNRNKTNVYDKIII